MLKLVLFFLFFLVVEHWLEFTLYSCCIEISWFCHATKQTSKKRKRKSFHYFITEFSRKSRVFVEFIRYSNRQRLFFLQKKMRCNLKFNRKTRRRHNAQHHAYYVRDFCAWVCGCRNSDSSDAPLQLRLSNMLIRIC